MDSSVIRLKIQEKNNPKLKRKIRIENISDVWNFNSKKVSIYAKKKINRENQW